MRKLAGTLLAVAIAVAGVIGLIAFFNARDDSTAGDQTKTERIAASGDGNVTVTYKDPVDAKRLRGLAEELGAPDTPELRAAGLAVIVEKGDAITATAGDETVTVGSVDDPALQDFIERWLGQGSSG